jgi:hypothetical protein
VLGHPRTAGIGALQVRDAPAAALGRRRVVRARAGVQRVQGPARDRVGGRYVGGR